MSLEMLGKGFLALLFLFNVVVFTHGLYVVYNDFTGKRKWWMHGPLTPISLTMVMLFGAVIVFTPIAYLFGWLITVML